MQMSAPRIAIIAWSSVSCLNGSFYFSASSGTVNSLDLGCVRLTNFEDTEVTSTTQSSGQSTAPVVNSPAVSTSTMTGQTNSGSSQQSSKADKDIAPMPMTRNTDIQGLYIHCCYNCPFSLVLFRVTTKR